MKPYARLVALLSLAATFVTPLAYGFGAISESNLKMVLLVATVAWFGSAYVWQRAEK